MAAPLSTFRTGKDGKGFKSEADAAKYIENQGLNDREYGTVLWQGAWYVEAYADTVKREREEKREEEEAAKTKAAKDTYKRVRFLGAHNPDNETARVELMCNGKCLVIEREKEVIVPQRFLNVADEAARVQIQPLANPRIGETPYVVGKDPVKTYPYQVIGDATEAEYLKMLEKGNKAQEEEFERLRRERESK